MAWAVRHSAYLINRFLIRAGGHTSYQAQWGRTHNTALCEFGETVMYMVLTLQQRPNLEPRFFRGTWLGKCTSTGESWWILRRCCRQSGTSTYSEESRRRSKVRQTNARNSERYTVEPFITTWIPTSFSTTTTASTTGKYRTSTAGRDNQPTWPSFVAGQDNCSCSQAYTQQRDDTTPASTDEAQAKKARTEDTKKQKTGGELTSTTHTTMRLGTSPTPVSRPPTTSRSLDDQIHEGSASKSRKETTQQQAATRPGESGEQAKKPQIRINAVTVQLKSGKKIATATSEDAQEVRA